MEIIELKMNKDLPTKLDQLEIITRRSFYLDKEERGELSRLRKGEEGEQEVLNYLKQYGRSHWIVIQNMWLDYHGPFESDLTLLTRNGTYLFEIKNYNGFFQYDHGISMLNHREISGNAIYQTRRALKNIRELYQRKYSKSNVQATLVFMGLDNPIEISPNIEDIHILQRNQLKYFIQRICAEEDDRTYQSIDSSKIVSHFDSFSTENPYQATPISPERMENLRKGILCAQCANSNVSISKLFVKCSCGHLESRDEAMVRTICEYGVLHYKNHLTKKTLFDFFNGQTSRTYLTTILRKYFKIIKRGRYTYYLNLKLPYSKIKHLFDFNITK